MNTSSYSGKFVLRIEPAFHEKLAHEAEKKLVSLNALCVSLLKEGLQKPAIQKVVPYNSLIKTLQNKFGRDFLALLLIGSQASGQATLSSDRDFLIIMSNRIPLSRALYQWWDNQVISPKEEQWNPQFVHLPVTVSEAGSLWFETAMNHQMIREKNGDVQQFIGLLKEMIAKDDIRRYWSNGHPYWVWRKNEEHLAHP